MELLLLLLGVILLVPILVLYTSFAWGYVASILYIWFILPIFPNAPELTWIQLASIMIFLNCFIKVSKTHIKEEYEDNSAQWTNMILNPWLTLLGAWIFKIILL